MDLQRIAVAMDEIRSLVYRHRADMTPEERVEFWEQLAAQFELGGGTFRNDYREDVSGAIE